MKSIKLVPIAAALALAIVSCGKKPQGETVTASDAQEVTAVSGESLSVNTEESNVSWIGYKPTGKHNGTFDIKSGSFTMTDKGIEGGKIVIDMTAITVLDIPLEEEGNAKLKGHLSSPDFFDVAQYPTATFEVTAIEDFDGTLPSDKEEFASDNTPMSASEYVVDSITHTVTGNLTIKDVTKSISFPASIVPMDERYQAMAKFNIDRMDWGIAYGDENSAVDKAKDKFIYNTVSVGFDLVLEK